mmetsp:Transcript_26272/g.40110  ORF Transcript_26272/g.40110 Transcript_26272/m.40110 type:complete len:99 (-) Transcript_26272:551-847(-)
MRHPRLVEMHLVKEFSLVIDQLSSHRIRGLARILQLNPSEHLRAKLDADVIVIRIGEDDLAPLHVHDFNAIVVHRVCRIFIVTWVEYELATFLAFFSR